MIGFHFFHVWLTSEYVTCFVWLNIFKTSCGSYEYSEAQHNLSSPSQDENVVEVFISPERVLTWIFIWKINLEFQNLKAFPILYSPFLNVCKYEIHCKCGFIKNNQINHFENEIYCLVLYTIQNALFYLHFYGIFQHFVAPVYFKLDKYIFPGISKLKQLTHFSWIKVVSFLRHIIHDFIE